jgi:hypothetical protein
LSENRFLELCPKSRIPKESGCLNPFTDEHRRFSSGNCRITSTDVPADIADRVIAKQVLTCAESRWCFAAGVLAQL